MNKTAANTNMTNVRKETFSVKTGAFPTPSRHIEEHITGDIEKITRLNGLLANEYTLFTKTLNYHWNVTGARFYSLHEFLEGHYKDLLEMIDGLAERIRELGGIPIGTLKEFAQKSDLGEGSSNVPSSSKMIADLMADHQRIQSEIKAIVSFVSNSDQLDPGTEDFLGSLIKQHEEMSWMLKAHLE